MPRCCYSIGSEAHRKIEEYVAEGDDVHVDPCLLQQLERNDARQLHQAAQAQRSKAGIRPKIAAKEVQTPADAGMAGAMAQPAVDLAGLGGMRLQELLGNGSHRPALVASGAFAGPTRQQRGAAGAVPVLAGRH
jgi:hypothetical protein